MRIYAACLAAYNAGKLHGWWIDASSDVEAMQEEINAMLKASPEPYAEEWAIHDYDDMPSDFGEFPGLKKIAAYVEFVEKAEDDHRLSQEVADAIVSEYCGDLELAKGALDRFCGTANTWRDFADDTADALMPSDAPDFLTTYFDYESFARDLRMNYTVIETAEGVAVFTA